MWLTSPRLSIHDAFAIHLGGPADNVGGGAGKFNSTRWLANAGTAGLVIRAVLNQRDHLRSTAILLNAPDNTVTPADMVAVKIRLWRDFVEAVKPAPAQQGIIVAYLDRLLLGYRSRVWNPRSPAHTAGAMFGCYGKQQAQQLTALANKLLDILKTYDHESLIPVQELIEQAEDGDVLGEVRVARRKRDELREEAEGRPACVI